MIPRAKIIFINQHHLITKRQYTSLETYRYNNIIIIKIIKSTLHPHFFRSCLRLTNVQQSKSRFTREI